MAVAPQDTLLSAHLALAVWRASTALGLACRVEGRLVGATSWEVETLAAMA